MVTTPGSKLWDTLQIEMIRRHKFTVYFLEAHFYKPHEY